MNKCKRVILKCYYRFLSRVNPQAYKKKYPAFLRKMGIQIPEDYYADKHGFIAPSVLFDANDYSLISIGKATTISIDVVFLTHDYSISKGLKSIGVESGGRFLKPIRVGENCFIGMRAILLPGTVLGDNVIVGAGSVVKGAFPDNVVIGGNPAKIICKTDEWANRHYELKDYQ